MLDQLTKDEIASYFMRAEESPRLRAHKILHEPGAYENAVFNFMCKGTYMKPHLHPGKEKIEHINVLAGRLVIFYFNDQGEVIFKKSISADDEENLIIVPAYTWHTYLMLADQVLTYETMDGVYDPKTWKHHPDWAPDEDSLQRQNYFDHLRNEAEKA